MIVPGADWHAVSTTETAALLETDPDTGLPESERTQRLARFGPNAATTKKPESWWEELAESFTEPLQLLLIAIAVLSAIFGEVRDAIAIAAVIATVAVLETASEQRAATAIRALKSMTAPTARLVGGGAVREVPAAELVPGDVIVVESGDVVPTDARVVGASGLKADESTLTGEAVPTAKGTDPVAAGADLADQSSMLFSGTAVVAGEGRAIVVATGAASQLGRLGKLVADVKEPPTRLQIALSRLARSVLIAALAASVVVPLVGIAAGQPWRDMLLAGLTVAFATVPEELPILVTVLLALGGRRLAKHGALLRRLRAGETLGAVTTVVTDKTGTLTENHLRLAEIVGDRHGVLRAALAVQPDGVTRREPLEQILAERAQAEGVTAASGRQVAVFPFDPATKLVSRAVAADTGTVTLAVSGAPEAVLARCELDPAARAAVEESALDLSRRGLRVIAFATSSLNAPPADREPAEQQLRLAGLAAFDDPLRTGVPQSVAALTEAGVATIVVTGDHPATAAAIANAAGLPASTPPRSADASIEHNANDTPPLAAADTNTTTANATALPVSTPLRGTDIDTMPPAALQQALHPGTVVARATPQTKYRIVQALRARGEVVAVTGDGANDAPALAAADVGIGMGRRGADLAVAAADLVLTDDAYPTVVTAVAAGRNITAQLRRAVSFYLGAKAALVVVLIAGLAAGASTVFLPVQIVLLELFMDLGASVAFVAEPAAPAAMHRPPRAPGTGFLDRPVGHAITITGATLTLAVLPTYLILHHYVGTGGARAGAVASWLAAHALIAWTLRTRPTLSWKANPAFPAWAILAAATGAVAAFTPAASLVHLDRLAPGWAGLVAGATVVATVASAVTNRLLRLFTRL